ncbi:MAG: hypothetical protein AB8C46_10565 [Burkholderiaceae bacterium]
MLAPFPLNRLLQFVAALWLFAAHWSVQAANDAPQVSPAIVDICLDLKRPPAICTCSATKLQASVQKDAFEHYHAVGARYLQLKRQGQRRRQAWAMAVNQRAESTGEQPEQLTEKMAGAADDHLLAIQDCGQQ